MVDAERSPGPESRRRGNRCCRLAASTSKFILFVDATEFSNIKYSMLKLEFL